MATLSLTVPIELPSAERMEELYREAAAAAVAQRDTWLSLDEAAEYLWMSRRSLDRKRVKWGLPVGELDGVKIVMRADLDAVAKAHLCTPGGRSPILPFPSQQPKSQPAGAAA